MTIRTLGLFAITSLAVACGGSEGSTNDADPRVISGGGIGDGAIKGRINVYVVDDTTDAPIQGATVLVGEPGETALEGTTDVAGLAVFEDESLDGASTVTAAATGYPASTWFGANGANITMPLQSANEATVPQATLTGTITGWADLPAPSQGHALIAIVNYSQTTDIGSAENSITQPGGGGGLPANSCVRSPMLTQCDWTLRSRTGNVTIYALVVDMDTNDNSMTMIGYAFADAITVIDGVNQSDLTLTLVAEDDLVDLEMTTEAAPSGLPDITKVAVLDLGAGGLALFGGLPTGDSDSLPVPALTGDFANASYRGIAVAGDSDNEQDEAPSSMILLDGITDLSSAVAFGPWLAQPAALAASNGEFSFTPSSGATLHTASIFDNTGKQLWDVALVDGRTTFTLPTLDSHPVPTTGLDLSVSALDADVDLDDFSIDDIVDSMDRTASDRTSL